jgi:hypothetical protein
MTTVGAVLDGLLREEHDDKFASLQRLVDDIQLDAGDAAAWATVRDVSVACVRTREEREALAARFSGRCALLAEALMLQTSRVSPDPEERRYQVTLRGAGKFPLAQSYPSARAATAAVCSALNADLARLHEAPDRERPSLLEACSEVVDEWSWSDTWAAKLCDAALLPEGAGGDDGLFVLCSDAAIHFVCRGEPGAPCVTVTPYDPTIPEDVYHVVDVAPVPGGPWPLWLTQSIVQLETCAASATHALSEPAPLRSATTFAFERSDAAQRARTYFRLRSAVVSAVYTVNKA